MYDKSFKRAFKEYLIPLDTLERPHHTNMHCINFGFQTDKINQHLPCKPIYKEISFPSHQQISMVAT